MAATVIWDTVEGQEFDLGTIQGYRLRTALIKDLDLTDTPDPEALDKAIAALGADGLAWLSTFSTLYTAFRLTRIIIKPITAKMVRAYMYYTLPEIIGASAYIVRDRTSFTKRRTNCIPGTRQPLLVDYIQNQDGSTGTGGTPVLTIPPDTYYIEIDYPIRQISIYQILFGRPTTFPSNICFANSATWQGLPAGYWKLDEYYTEVSRYSGNYTVEAAFSSRVIEDWSETQIAVDKRTGRTVKLDSGLTDTVNALPYTYGPIYPTSGPNGKGYARTGPFPTVSFSTLTGIS